METQLPRNKVKIDPGISSGNPISQEQSQNWEVPSNTIWKPYFPGTQGQNWVLLRQR